MKKGILKIAGAVGIGVIGAGAVGSGFMPNSVLKSDEKTIISTSIVGVETAIVLAYATGSAVKGAKDFAESVLNERKKLLHEMETFAKIKGLDEMEKVYKNELKVINKFYQISVDDLKDQSKYDKKLDGRAKFLAIYTNAAEKKALDAKQAAKLQDLENQFKRSENLKATLTKQANTTPTEDTTNTTKTTIF